MMFVVGKEPDDARVAIHPAVAAKLISDGHEVWVEEGAGEKSFYPDASYEVVGAKMGTKEALFPKAHVLARISPPSEAELALLAPKTMVIAQFDTRSHPERKTQLAATDLWPFSLDLIPRTTIAQSMDILSSMASLAGYKAVLEAAHLLPSYFPMLMSAAGTIPPAKILILGAGVAGLQAIATARRLGAVVEAFDVRSAVKEEVESLGAKFVEVAGAREDQAAGGYAVTQTEEYQAKQRALIHERASKSDVIITTANIPGRTAPILITAETIKAMKPGSVIIDMASATGGNCELSKDQQSIQVHGVQIVGNSNLADSLPRDASALFANNILSFFRYICPDGPDKIDFANEIVSATYLGAPQVAAAKG
ncbi:MAG: NAD(P) transhydrogenase subunit alpha [Bacteroidota bacterium]